MVKDPNKRLEEYPHIIPQIEDWPIYLLHDDRKKFVDEIDSFTVERLNTLYDKNVGELIAKTIYKELIRIKEEPWKVDPPKEKQYWKKIQSKLVDSLDSTESTTDQRNQEILNKIVNRYSEEIVGTFRTKTFLFARKFSTLLFTRLLNTAAARNIWQIWGNRYRLMDRLMVKGEVEKIRSLAKKGTIVVVPTHFSNLDSILIGYALDTFAGLPSFSYGAGLNLFNSGAVAYFINRLGAYRVDRRKKNTIYLETLKAMSNLSIQRGTNSLFFPGGTRSRSGALETRLKLGLLSTVIDAQRSNLQKGKKEKIFVVPLVLGYHFVLEAKSLIDQHLKKIGKERYIKSRDEFYSRRKLFFYAWQFFSESNEINLSFGQPMDVLGNPVDEEGNSYDQYGNLIQIEDYFKENGAISTNLQRESEYTQMLGEKIVERYHKDNIVLTSHLVAFAAFQMLCKQNKQLDLYGVLRLPTEDYLFDESQLKKLIAQLKERLFQMEAEQQIRLSDPISWTEEEILRDGIRRLGSYHVQKPIRYNKNKEIVSNSFKILYYYHNRLENYGLDKVVKLDA
ncbi:MAG: 1-acyl-sn-glycerol-3-phosphate acyltransferase [Saprospiraceae bacterium]|nr:1-acyl-sn-glycerol-3-phosphate acyltransferase [Saprospiraceae bacterium]